MQSVKRGSGTTTPEVARVTARGLWLRVDGREVFMAFADFPWFRGAPLEQVLRVTRPWPEHLRWPGLDVDLELESIEHPKRFPLIFGTPAPTTRVRRARSASRASSKRETPSNPSRRRAG